MSVPRTRRQPRNRYATRDLSLFADETVSVFSHIANAGAITYGPTNTGEVAHVFQTGCPAGNDRRRLVYGEQGVRPNSGDANDGCDLRWECVRVVSLGAPLARAG